MKKIHEFISDLDEAKYGSRRVAEGDEVASSPDHAPTSTKQWKTPSSGKSEDEGEKVSKEAIKKSDASIPAPVAKAPSHAPTSTAQWKTKDGNSSDEGEKISKEAMKENLIRTIIDSDGDVDVAALITQADVQEGGHKAGCGCGFCKNKGSFGKKKEDAEKKDEKPDDAMEENYGGPARPLPRPAAAPMKRRLSGGPGPGAGRMGFRHPAGPRPKAAMAPYQSSMENLDKSANAGKSIQEMADKLLEAPNSAPAKK